MLDKTARLDDSERVTISKPRFGKAVIPIRGTAPYVGNKMSTRDIDKMRQDQEAGQQARSRKRREPKDFTNLHREKIHVSGEGWYGIPAAAFRCAMIDACRVAGYKMTMAKMSVFVLPDGFDKDDGQPLVRIVSSAEPRSFQMIGRYNNTSTDILVRPQWMQWGCNIPVKWDEDQFSAEDVVNLLCRAGEQVGVGAGRPFSRETPGLGFGTWEVVNKLMEESRKGKKRNTAKQA